MPGVALLTGAAVTVSFSTEAQCFKKSKGENPHACRYQWHSSSHEAPKNKDETSLGQGNLGRPDLIHPSTH